MRNTAALLLAAFVAACESPTVPFPLGPDQLTWSTNDSIYRVARSSVPIDDSQTLTIGILDEARTPTFARVTYENAAEWVMYGFLRETSGWRRGFVIAKGEFSNGFAVDSRANGLVYDGMIAQIGSPVIDEWYVSNLRSPGTHYSSEFYGSLEPTTARFFPGSQVANDSVYAVSFVQWMASRTGCDSFFWTSSSNPYTAGQCWPGGGAPPNNNKPQAWTLTYQLSRTYSQPPTFSISDWESNNSEYRRVGITYVSSGAPVTSYQWATSTDGFSGWTPLSTSACAGPAYVGSFRTDAGGPFYFRAIVTNANGQTGSDIHGPLYVDLNDVWDC